MFRKLTIAALFLTSLNANASERLVEFEQQPQCGKITIVTEDRTIVLNPNKISSVDGFTTFFGNHYLKVVTNERKFKLKVGQYALQKILNTICY